MEFELLSLENHSPIRKISSLVYFLEKFSPYSILPSCLLLFSLPFPSFCSPLPCFAPFLQTRSLPLPLAISFLSHFFPSYRFYS